MAVFFSFGSNFSNASYTCVARLFSGDFWKTAGKKGHQITTILKPSFSNSVLNHCSIYGTFLNLCSILQRLFEPFQYLVVVLNHHNMFATTEPLEGSATVIRRFITVANNIILLKFDFFFQTLVQLCIFNFNGSWE